MPDIVNPYQPGAPVGSPDLFFGRRDLLSSIREHLVKGRRTFLVSGARRMGKTSLLQQLPAHLPEQFVPVRVELAQVQAPGLDRLVWRMVDAIVRQTSPSAELPSWETVAQDTTGGTDLLMEQFWPRIRESLGNRCLVLMLDDLDSLDAGAARLLEPFVGILTRWRDQDSEVALVATVHSSRREGLLRTYPRLLGDALVLTLGPLSGEESTRLVTWPVEGVLTYDYGVARRMVDTASGHPYYLQLLCYETFNRCAATGWVSQHDADAQTKELVRREIADFREVWEHSSPPEQAVLAALVSLKGARGVATVQEVRTVLTKAGARVGWNQVTGVLEGLAAREVLERLGAHSYRFRVALLRDWLCERIDLLEVVRHARWASAAPDTSAGDQRLTRLPVHKRQPPPKEEPAAPAPAAEEPPARKRPWLGIVAVTVFGLVLLLVGGRATLPGPWAAPTPTANPSASLVAQLATATKTPGVQGTKRPAVPSPTHTPVPLPVPTATPTPPLVVARTVPSIAFQSRGPGEKRWSIYAMNSDGSNRTRIGDGQAEFLSAPAWSPDGAKIAYVSDQDGAPDIWVMNGDGSNPINLTQDKGKDHSPAWSPDGDWIAFSSVRDSVFWELYLIRPDGTDLQRLTWWEDASDLWPSWSPDGTRLAFASKRDGNWEIYTMDRDGSNLARLTDHPTDDTSPAWSPDGSRIAFESTRDGYAEIYVLPAAGGAAVNVSNTPLATDLGPTWSPDGGRIAFYSDRDGEWDIYVMNSDGSDPVKLTGDNSNDQVPAWRP